MVSNARLVAQRAFSFHLAWPQCKAHLAIGNGLCWLAWVQAEALILTKQPPNGALMLQSVELIDSF